ncbi:hypothetical protein E0J09_03170 [Rhizobium leguminosarum bv. viciae]|nr:hypothetical protein E0H41_03170 [Rhizobium leguminosarum bv. viciae]TCB30808.1 hypothetical protein E0J09_03170 [Rhizobium leguminosarum bv. viciae]
MRSDWPLFRVRKSNRFSAVWIGDVKPQFANYRLEIRYVVGDFPEVRVRSPELVKVPENPDGPLPHIYGPLSDPTLCLFDPAADEWDGCMLISRTTVPWSIDWITFYEFWLMTGVWSGGGRHPDGSPQEAVQQ